MFTRGLTPGGGPDARPPRTGSNPSEVAVAIHLSGLVAFYGLSSYLVTVTATVIGALVAEVLLGTIANRQVPTDGSL